MVWGGHWTYIFSKSPVLKRIENDQGLISAIEKQGHIRSIVQPAKQREEDVPQTVVRLRVNKVRSYEGEIASANPLHGPSRQHFGKVRNTNKMGLRSVLNHLGDRVSCAINRYSDKLTPRFRQ